MTDEPDGLLGSVRRRRARHQDWVRHGEPSFARYLAQVGVLGWAIVVPTLLGVFLGRWIDFQARNGYFLDGAAAVAWAGYRLLVRLAMDARTMIADAGFLAAGAVAGLVYFGLLRWNTTLYLGGERIAMGAALHIARLGAARRSCWC